MLFALHIEVAHKLVGMAPSSFFQYATGLSRMRFQRGQGYRSLVERHQKRGVPDDSLQASPTTSHKASPH